MEIVKFGVFRMLHSDEEVHSAGAEHPADKNAYVFLCVYVALIHLTAKRKDRGSTGGWKKQLKSIKTGIELVGVFIWL
jgi:hypothetical protein